MIYDSGVARTRIVVYGEDEFEKEKAKRIRKLGHSWASNGHPLGKKSCEAGPNIVVG